MSKRAVILVGMAAGLIWSVALVRCAIAPASAFEGQGLAEGLSLAGFLAGSPLLLMIGRLAQRRFFDDSIIDGQPYAEGSAAQIDQRVLTNTTEQLVLAAAIWPMASVLSHPGAAIWLALGFLVTRLLFWVGYHLSPPLRGFGFAASFYPTLVVALWVIWSLLKG